MEIAYDIEITCKIEKIMIGICRISFEILDLMYWDDEFIDDSVGLYATSGTEIEGIVLEIGTNSFYMRMPCSDLIRLLGILWFI